MSRRHVRRAVWVVAAIIAVNGLLALVGGGGRQLTGPPSSSYATVPEGLAAWAQLLSQAGHPLTRRRTAPSDGPALDPRATLVLLEADAVPPADVRAIEAFVRAGGRLVAGGSGPQWYQRLLTAPARSTPSRLEAASALAPLPEVGSARELVTRAQSTWERAGAALPAVGAESRAVLVVAALGRGRVALVSDPAVVQNRLLSQADNAALALALAGGSTRPVVFAESYHGFGPSQGLAALPPGWRWALIGTGLAGLVWVAAHLRRLGPPEEEARALPPPRRAYVDAMAQTLERTRDPEQAARPLQAAGRTRLARLASLTAHATGPDLERAARHAGLDEASQAALFAPARTEADLIAAGRALAQVQDPGRRG